MKKSSNIAVFGNIHKLVTLIRGAPFSNYKTAVYGNRDFSPPDWVHF